MWIFTEPGVRRLRANTPVNLTWLAKSDVLVEMIQIHLYLEDVSDIGCQDFRRYTPRYGNPNYVFHPRLNGDSREKDQDNRTRERFNMGTEHEQMEHPNARNQYLNPLNNSREGIYEQSIFRNKPSRKSMTFQCR